MILSSNEVVFAKFYLESGLLGLLPKLNLGPKTRISRMKVKKKKKCKKSQNRLFSRSIRFACISAYSELVGSFEAVAVTESG